MMRYYGEVVGIKTIAHVGRYTQGGPGGVLEFFLEELSNKLKKISIEVE